MALLAAASVSVYFLLVWTASVEAPFLDDFDAVLGFLASWLEADDWQARGRIFFRPHNEHVLGLPHVWVLASHALTGHLDVRLLNLIGNAHALLLLAALLASFHRDAPAGIRIAAFAPAVLFVCQPQHWTALLSPTVSLSNVGVVAWAAVALAAAERPGAAPAGLTAAAALGAVLSQANGILVWPLVPVVLLLRGCRGAALGWSLAAAVGLALFLAASSGGSGRADPLDSLAQPTRLAAYLLGFLGCAPGFSRPGPSIAAGAALLASFAVLVWRGLPRQSPAFFALFLFLLGSAAANALLRSHQGAGAALLQPRYAFYSAVLLALTGLAWSEQLPGRPIWQRSLLAAAAIFCLASFATAGPDVTRLSRRLSDGLDQWWRTGEGGLIHPDFRKATFFMLKGLDRGLIQIPDEWAARYAAVPQRREAPPAAGPVSQRIDALHQQRNHLIVSGWAVAGNSAVGQEVEIVLAAPDGLRFYPALEVLRVDLPQHSERLARQLAPSGFRALIATHDLAAGDYRLGILVRKGAAEHLTWRQRPVSIGASER